MFKKKNFLNWFIQKKKFFIPGELLNEFFNNNNDYNNLKGHFCRIKLRKHEKIYSTGLLRNIIYFEKKNIHYIKKKKILIRKENLLQLFPIDYISNYYSRKEEIRIFLKFFFSKKTIRNSFFYNSNKFYQIKTNFIKNKKIKTKLPQFLKIKINLICS
jgi:hypothetical protein